MNNIKTITNCVIKLSLVAFAYSILVGSLIAARPNSCIECHSAINEEITLAYEHDVHAESGITCTDCHGGDQTIEDEDSMDPDKGFIGVPDRLEQPAMCAKCHSDPTYMRNYNPSMPTDQLDKYWTSHHGQLLKKNDKKVAVCSSCHGSHGVLPASQPKSMVFPTNVPATCGVCHSDNDYMAGYNIPTNQYAQYTDTLNVHGNALLVNRDLAAPACNDCHGNHGANPPGVSNIHQLCAQCHTQNARFYESSPHFEGFEALEVPECAFCHQQSPDVDSPTARIHTIVKPEYTLVGTHENAVCVQCHSAGDDGWMTAEAIFNWRDSLETSLHNVNDLLHRVEQQGIETSDARWMLDGDVKQSMMSLKTEIHVFDLDIYRPVFVHADTLMRNILEEGDRATLEVANRRNYYYIFTLLIAVFCVLLVMKIKEIERH